MAAATAGGRVIALDFDGVVCDSVGESSLSAFKVRNADIQAAGFVNSITCYQHMSMVGPSV
jgi:hypothetical protein